MSISSQGAPGGLIWTKTDISSAELLALNATPINIVPAPGANKILILDSALVFYNYNSTAYAGIGASEDLAIKWNTGSGTIAGSMEATGFLDATSDQYRLMSIVGTLTATITPQINTALVLHMTVGEITTGNSPLVVITRHSVLDLAAWSAI